MARELPLPRDLADEIAAELRSARRRAAFDGVRVGSLEALLEVVRRVSGGLRRPATPGDVLADAPDAVERDRRRRLLLALRERADRDGQPGDTGLSAAKETVVPDGISDERSER
jgi:hypothetical protein